jgi:hypothetical protein
MFETRICVITYKTRIWCARRGRRVFAMVRKGCRGGRAGRIGRRAGGQASGRAPLGVFGSRKGARLQRVGHLRRPGCGARARALLADEQLASWARIALQAIPDPAADEALRQALNQLQGRLLIGVINTIAVRRDAQAADGLVQRLKDPDIEVAAAAAVALGRVGGPAAAKALEASLADAPIASARPWPRAASCTPRSSKPTAMPTRRQEWFDAVRQADVPKQRIVEATRGAILARGTEGTPLLLEQLLAGQGPLCHRAAHARELAGREVTEALAAELPQMTLERQALLLLVLADRGDTAALPAVLAATRSSSEAVRSASMIAWGNWAMPRACRCCWKRPPTTTRDCRRRP